jgi:hypothetical protein
MGWAGSTQPADTLWSGLIREPAFTLWRCAPLLVPGLWCFWQAASRVLGGVSLCVPGSAAP